MQRGTALPKWAATAQENRMKCECKLPGWRNPALSKRSPIPDNVHKHDNPSRKRKCNNTKLFPSVLGLFPHLCFPSAGTGGWSERVSAERRDSVLPNSCQILHSTFLPLGEGTFSDAAASCVPRPAAHREPLRDRQRICCSDRAKGRNGWTLVNGAGCQGLSPRALSENQNCNKAESTPTTPKVE